MDVKVSEIPAEGRKVDLTFEPDELEGLGGEVKALGAVKASFRLKKVGLTVYLTGDMEALLGFTCARCGKVFENAVRSEFSLDLNPLESLTKEDERELQAADLEVEFYKEDTINLLELLREQILLHVPMKPLCREECPGLCQYCGHDLNEGACGCEAPTGHPGFADLKDFFKDKG